MRGGQGGWVWRSRMTNESIILFLGITGLAFVAARYIFV